MKKVYFSMLAVAMLASCSENEITTPKGPSKPGSEVNFTLRLADADLSTRTIYGDEDSETNAFPIYWVDGDQVAMASPQAAVKNAPYSISVEPGATNQNYATTMTKIGEAGIQWGTSFPQNFYSIYPCKYTDVNDKIVENTIAVNGNAAEATLHVRDTQRQLFVYDSDNHVWKGTPVDETGMKNPDAIMYAQRQMNADGDVVLQYVPFTTAFNITLQGYEYYVTPAGVVPVVIQEVIIEAPAGVKLAGDFTVDFDANATATPVVNEESITNASNIIRVLCLKDETNYIQPTASTDAISFNVFAIPTDGEVTENWKLHVVTNYGNYTRNLKPTENKADAGKLVAGQVHKLSMPKISVTSETPLNPERWMMYIPRNVYITDLSLPGAWYSQQKEYQGTNNDSEWTIQDLWDKGVRAFSVETRTATNATELSTDGTPAYVGVSGSGKNQALLGVGGAYFYGATNVSEVIKSVCNAVNGSSSDATQKKYGFAILALSYADGGRGGHRQRDYDYWLEGLYNAYNSLPADVKNTIYGSKEGEELTPNTTIGDVAGRVILRVNVASGLPGIEANQRLYPNDGMIHKGNYADNLPALLTYVNRERAPGTAPVSIMHWKEWSDEFLNNVDISIENNDDDDEVREILKTLGPNTFYCNYSIANRTAPIDDDKTLTDNNLPTYTARKQALGRILRNSSLSLELGNHNLWSLFAAGGSQATSATSTSTDPVAFAVTMNQWILDELDSRIASGNYGPFGNVFCNYIANKAESNGVFVDGNDIIERILRMNQLFRLSRDEDKPEWPDNGGGTPAQSPANYSSSLSKDQNGWNAF